MAVVTNNDADVALRIIVNTSLRRDNAIQAYNAATHIESDDGQDSESLILDSFYSTGGS